jgi:hypothetical protein
LDDGNLWCHDNGSPAKGNKNAPAPEAFEGKGSGVHFHQGTPKED